MADGCWGGRAEGRVDASAVGADVGGRSTAARGRFVVVVLALVDAVQRLDGSDVIVVKLHVGLIALVKWSHQGLADIGMRQACNWIGQKKGGTLSYVLNSHHLD